jgi:hypothetical protein
MTIAQSSTPAVYSPRMISDERVSLGSDVPPVSRPRAILLRGLVWGLIGLIYTPLFMGLAAIFERVGSGVGPYPAAAALAGAAGAAFYGAREVALVGSGIGVSLGLLLLVTMGDSLTFGQTVLLAGCVAATVGLVVVFPGRCARKVPGKIMAGLTTGSLCGAALAATEPLHPAAFPIFSVLAFLVSVNGVLYVATVRWWVALAKRLDIEARPCNAIEALVIAVLAGISAGSVWLMAAPLLAETSLLVREVSDAVYLELPLALLGGIFGGAVAGALLESLGFAWVHDV